MITWPAPASIVYGTPLSVIQLNATATDPTNECYGGQASSPTLRRRTRCSAVGTTTLSVTFTPDSRMRRPTRRTRTTVQITVTAATLTVTADNQTMVYGGTVPTLTATITGFVAGDVPSQVTGTASCTTRARRRPPGFRQPLYDHLHAGDAGRTQLHLYSFATATLTVTAATPTVSLGCQEVTYDGNPHGCVGVGSRRRRIDAGGRELDVQPAASETAPGSYPVTGTFTSSDPNNAIRPAVTASGR